MSNCLACVMAEELTPIIEKEINQNIRYALSNWGKPGVIDPSEAAARHVTIAVYDWLKARGIE